MHVFSKKIRSWGKWENVLSILTSRWMYLRYFKCKLLFPQMMIKNSTCVVLKYMVQSGQCQITCNLTLWTERVQGKSWCVSPPVVHMPYIIYQLILSCIANSQYMNTHEYFNCGCIFGNPEPIFFSWCTSTIVNAHLAIKIVEYAINICRLILTWLSQFGIMMLLQDS